MKVTNDKSAFRRQANYQEYILQTSTKDLLVHNLLTENIFPSDIQAEPRFSLQIIRVCFAAKTRWWMSRLRWLHSFDLLGCKHTSETSFNSNASRSINGYHVFGSSLKQNRPLMHNQFKHITMYFVPTSIKFLRNNANMFQETTAKIKKDAGEDTKLETKTDKQKRDS